MDNEGYKLLDSFLDAIDGLDAPLPVVFRMMLLTGIFPATVRQIMPLGDPFNPPKIIQDSSTLRQMIINSIRISGISEMFFVQSIASYLMDALTSIPILMGKANEEFIHNNNNVLTRLSQKIGVFTSLSTLNALRTPQ